MLQLTSKLKVHLRTYLPKCLGQLLTKLCVSETTKRLWQHSTPAASISDDAIQYAVHGLTSHVKCLKYLHFSSHPHMNSNSEVLQSARLSVSLRERIFGKAHLLGSVPSSLHLLKIGYLHENYSSRKLCKSLDVNFSITCNHLLRCNSWWGNAQINHFGHQLSKNCKKVSLVDN